MPRRKRRSRLAASRATCPARSRPRRQGRAGRRSAEPRPERRAAEPTTAEAAAGDAGGGRAGRRRRAGADGAAAEEEDTARLARRQEPQEEAGARATQNGAEAAPTTGPARRPGRPRRTAISSYVPMSEWADELESKGSLHCRSRAPSPRFPRYEPTRSSVSAASSTASRRASGCSWTGSADEGATFEPRVLLRRRQRRRRTSSPTATVTAPRRRARARREDPDRQVPPPHRLQASTPATGAS